MVSALDSGENPEIFQEQREKVEGWGVALIQMKLGHCEVGRRVAAVTESAHAFSGQGESNCVSGRAS